MSDPILVWGAGAIGGVLGAAFIRAGEHVVFVDTADDHVAAINRSGLTITGPVAPHHVSARACRPEALEGLYRRCILAVKAHHTADAIAALAPHLAADGYVVSAQNGLNETTIAACIGAERTIGCFVNFGADYLEPGVVLYGGRGAVVLGEIDGAATERLDDLHRLFLSFDPGAIATPNIWGYLWSKLIYGAFLFATALTDDSIADVLAMNRYRPMLTRLAHEVVAVSLAEGVRLEAFNGFDPAAFLPGTSTAAVEQSFDAMVAFNRKSAKSHSGIWRDLAVRKRRTEVDAQLGPIVTIAERHGLPVPILAALIERIHEVENGQRTRTRHARPAGQSRTGGQVMKFDLTGRTALVTGAGHGFGRATAIALAEVGAQVIACDVRDDELPETAALAGPSCMARTLDVTDETAIAALMAELQAAGRSIDILVNNAGGVLGQVGRPLEAISRADWQAIVEVNLTGAFLMAQAVSPGMKAAGWGRIVNISSGAGLGISLTGIQAYASAKAGQIGLTRQLAHELGPFGITVNNVAPGFVRSNPATERQWFAMGAEGQARLVQSIATKRLGSPEDIAYAVLFFASEFAAWVSGQVLSVDGGR